MAEFNDITIVREANIYFEGKVTSRTILFADGSRKSLGIMLPGEYEFATADRELMEIQSGEIEVLLPGNDSWQSMQGGQSFEVPADSKFGIRIKAITDYCCSYLT